jgi:hypothetical protein
MRQDHDPPYQTHRRETPTVHVLGNVRIEQPERFIGMFATAGPEVMGRHGNRGTELLRVAGE